MMDYKKLADLLYPNTDKTIDYYINKYPKRDLPNGAEVMRIAPSPTGYLHTGHAYSAFISRATTRKTNGVFYMRLEDTDQKRLIENAGTIAYDMLCYYDMKPDEGYTGDGKEQVGIYGDYIQSNRLEIYNTFAKHLVSIGRAFPCFCEKSEGKEDVLNKRQEQLESSDTLEDKDECRNLTLEQVEENLKQGKKFALRLLSTGNIENTFKFTDEIKGERVIRENTKDVVLMKSNGIPPYCFAHVVDDTLMHTTTVVRGEEWYPSLSAHIEIFKAFGFNPPKYAHTPVICKLDDGNKRKLSKRKDPEADVRYFIEQGYPVDSIMEYLLNLLNSDFEQWREKNPTLPYTDFDFKISKIGSNNPMFDFNKLNDVSKNFISKLSKDRVYSMLTEYAKVYDNEFYNLLTKDEEYSKNVLNIDRETAKPRKDIAKWNEVKPYYNYMFDLFNPTALTDYEIDVVDTQKLKEVCQAYTAVYNQADDKQTWFNRIKEMADSIGYASDNKLYKQNPQNYKGNVSDICMYIRIAVTGRKNSPDLYSICSILGYDKVMERLNDVCKF
ncbi:MAG: glutamate--tRNA ligase [Clostridia bacterium]|nr:glutamate--tRNA ligase [Clostridia bacterium]